MRSETRGRVKLLASIVKSATDNDHRSEVISSFTRVSLTSEYSPVEQISAKLLARNAELLPLPGLNNPHVTFAIFLIKLVHDRWRILSPRIPFKQPSYNAANDPSARNPHLVIHLGWAICNLCLYDI